MEDKKIINGNCWVAYFDILGFKNQVYLNRGQLSILAHMYEEVIKHINGELKNIPNFGSLYECSWFSDTFLLYSLDDSISRSYKTIYSAAKHFFDYMVITKKWLLRGAITVGDFYADMKNGVYLGEALIDAYKFAEKQDWIGFVLTPAAYDKLSTDGHAFTWVDGFCFREYGVPIKRQQESDGLEQTTLDCKKLWAYHYRYGDCRRDIIMDSLRRACNKGDRLAIRHRRKHKNTLRFYEAPCKCSVCSKFSMAKK